MLNFGRMRRKAAEKAKSSPEKVSRRTTRRGRKSPSASPEREESAAKEQSDEEQQAAEPAEQRKSDNSGSEPEEEEAPKRGRVRRSSRAKASEEKTNTRPRRSSRRKSQSVEPSDREESEKEENGENSNDKDAAVMETIPEEKPEEVQEPVSKSPEPRKDDNPQDAKEEVIIEETKTEHKVINKEKSEDEETTDKQNGEQDETEKPVESQKDFEESKPELCDQSRESGEVDSESVQEEESQQASEEKPTKEASPEKEASEEESSSEKDIRKSESPKPVRKSRFRSRTKSPVARELPSEPTQQDNGDDKNDDELEAGEIKDDDTPKRSPEKKPTEEKPLRRPLQRKRRWLSSKSDTKASVITISTDSLKNIISEPVQPVPLSDVKLESSPEPEEIVDSNEEQPSGERRRSKDKLSIKSLEKENIEEQDHKAPKPTEKLLGNRKISIVSDDGNTAIARPPSPAKHHSSNILYITNLVRPFTVLQLKSLLARTGKIVENGFWIDKIKSKCFVKYETEDEAVETRHALHGVRWPASNPKCLHVDFGTESAMEKAIISTLDDAGTTRITMDSAKDAKEFGWSRDSLKQEEETHVVRPVREWDLGKKDTFDREDRGRAEGDRGGRERERERERDRDRERERDRDRSGRVDEGRGDRGRRRSSEREFGRDRDRRRGSTSVSPARKFKKKENEPPIRLLDDLFRKTKTTPCIYWLPLTAEQITVKDEQRRKELAETQRRQEESRKQEEERRKERERRDRERRERPRSNSRDRRRRSRSRDDNRRRHR